MRLIAQIARIALAAAATSGVLVAGARAGGALHGARAAASLPAHVHVADPYPRRSAPEIRIGDAVAVNGQRMQLAAFTTRDPPERIIQFYEESFRQRGLIPIAAVAERLGHVSVFDPADGLQRFVTATPERSGHTLVLVGATDPREFPFLRSRHQSRAQEIAPPAPYPVPDGHRAFVGYESEDGPVRAQGGQFVSTLTAAEIARFYRARLTARGFVERPESSPGLLAFVNGQEQISVAVQSLEQERGAAVFVTRVEGAP